MKKADATAAEVLNDLRRGGVKFRGAFVEHDGWISIHGADIDVALPPGIVRQIEKFSLVDVEGNEQERVIFRVTREELLKKHEIASEARRADLRRYRW